MNDFNKVRELLSGDLNCENVTMAKEILGRHKPKFKINPLSSAEFAYKYAVQVLEGPFPEGEDLIATDAHLAYQYAVSILEGPFPKGESIIAADANYACGYANGILHGRFLEGEPTIATSPRFSFEYAYNVLRDRFPEGEPAIATDAKYAYAYAMLVVNDYSLYVEVILKKLEDVNHNNVAEAKDMLDRIRDSN